MAQLKQKSKKVNTLLGKFEEGAPAAAGVQEGEPAAAGVQEGEPAAAGVQEGAPAAAEEKEIMLTDIDFSKGEYKCQWLLKPMRVSE